MSDDVITWYRGADLDLVIRASAAITDSDTPVRVIGKAVRSASSPVPLAANPVAFELAATFVADPGDGKNRWTLAGSDTQSLTLDPGYYVVDAAMQVAGRVKVLSPVYVRLVESVGGGIGS
jgi:hypothetical protein